MSEVKVSKQDLKLSTISAHNSASGFFREMIEIVIARYFYNNVSWINTFTRRLYLTIWMACFYRATDLTFFVIFTFKINDIE